ncbi:MAG: NAD(P)-dependent alcohol dehydrogenase [Actinomycetia bacterium]|nr:NAD(P)-dependent alcohol dehydrogenase [Actinomycetes bacterium]
MKAIVQDGYGAPSDVLELRDVDMPTVDDDRVLVAVKAASINPLDWHLIRGTPYLVRMQAGLRNPKRTTPGADVAGVVEAVGDSVTRFQPGDEVFGEGYGTCCEYVSISEKGLSLKPQNVTFEQAAAVPIAAQTALQGLRDKGQVQPGQHVLVNGASGGVGTFACQIARSLGAQVTGVCSTRNVDLVRSIGADNVIDYTSQNYTAGTDRYDVILDTVGSESLAANKRALTPNGRYVSVGAEMGNWVGPLTHISRVLTASVGGDQKFAPMLATLSSEDLGTLRDMIETGDVTPVIDRTYPLSAVPEAIQYVERGHTRGKVVIQIS